MPDREPQDTQIQIQVNGQPRALQAGSSLEDLLASLGVPSMGTAVELDGAIVAPTGYATTLLGDGQCLEIVRLVGGG